ncbi:polyphosphate polymerase domain-containing protein [Glycomyces paridis]|uniref:polyphosphate polymerase domain-containing protein n=1 Tax=Glycomyces paridis TaxID=2126555 RepID=UPI001958220A|nr:polyphosphate polymerase domain-containing protein [Glycomyces paridis]
MGLAELLAVAELQTRVDRKYLVRPADLGPLLEGADGGLAVLEIEGRRRFDYESVYFDAPGLPSFLGTARGRRRCFKVRTRSYLDSGVCMLEIKTRAAEATVKRRLDYECGDRGTVTAAGRAWIEASGVVPVAAGALEPVLVTRYVRSTVLDRRSGARLTCDVGLRFADGRGRSGALGGDLAVVEVKSPGRAVPLDRLLWAAGYRPEPISKYGTGMALLRPELPANKWNRTLRRHFGWRPADGRAGSAPAPRRLSVV